MSPKMKHVLMTGGTEQVGSRVANPIVYPNVALRPKGELIAPVLSFAIVATNPIVLEFSEELDDNFVPATSDFAAVKNGGAAAITSVAVVGTTVKLTMTVAIVQGDTLTVAYTKPTANTRLRDLRGNEVASFTAQTVLNYTPGAADSTVPVLALATVQGANMVLYFDEQLDTTSVPAVTAFAVVIGGGADVVTVVAINGNVVRLTLTTAATYGQSATVAYTAPGANMLQDLAGNDVATFGATTALNYTGTTPDTQVPRLSRIYGSGTSIVLDYDEQLTENSPTLTAFAVVVNGSGATESSAVVSGSVVTITIATGLVPGDTFTVAYTAGAIAIQDLAGNVAANFGATSGLNLSLDTQAPRLSYISGNGATIYLHYDEPLTENAPTITAFAVLVNGGAVTESNPVVAGHVVSFTISTALVETDSFTVAYTAGATPIEDRAGNNAANFGATAGVNITTSVPDTQVPRLSYAYVKDTTLTLLYDEQLDTASTPATTAYSIVVDGAGGVNPSAVVVTGSTVKLTMTAPAVTSVITVSYTAGGSPVQDLAGNDAANLTAQAVQNLTGDKVAPVAGTLRVNGTQLLVFYDETLDSTSVPATGAYAVVKNGGAAAVTSVGIAGSIVTITLTVAAVTADVITLAYTAGANPVRDLASNNAANFGATAVRNTTSIAADTVAPRFSFAIVNATTLLMVYDEQLDTASVPAVTAFSVVVNGAAGVNPSAVAINGDTVSLTISAVVSTDIVTVAYTAPGSNMIQDLVGNDAINLGAQSCINVTITTAPITVTLLTAYESATTANSYATASVTPTAYKLILACVLNEIAAGAPTTPTVSGNSLTWVQVNTQVFNTTSRVTVFRAMGASPSAGAVTADFGGVNQIGCTIRIIEFGGTDTTGTNGSGAVPQSAVGTIAGNITLTITLAALQSGSASFGFMAHHIYSPPAITVGSGYTKIGTDSVLSLDPPSDRSMAEWAEAGSLTVDASNPAAIRNWGGVALEIKKGITGAPDTADYLVGSAQAGLSAEIVVGTTPGGELGGTWAAPTVDGTHSGSAHHAVYAHPNHSGEVTSVGDGAQTVVATHSGSAHHAAETGESATHNHGNLYYTEAEHGGVTPTGHHTRAHAVNGASDHSAGTLGDVPYGGVAGAWTLLAGQITTAKQFLTQTGTGAVSAAPVWAAIADTDVPATHSGSAHHTNTQVGHGAWHGDATVTAHHTAFVQADHDALANPHHSNANDHAASHTHASHTGIGATDHHSNANDHVRAHAMDGASDHSAGTLGDLIYGGVAGAWTKLAGQITTTRNFLRQTGTGAASAAPAWDTLVDGDIPTTLTAVTNHAAAADPHTGYRLESADHSHATTGLQAGQLLAANTHGTPSADTHHAQSHTHASHTGIGATDHHSNANDHAILTIGADVQHSLVGQVLSGVDAAAAQKGHIQLAGELSGTAASPTVAGTHSGSAHHTRAHAVNGASDHSAGTLGDTVYGGVAGAWTLLAGQITTAKQFLTQTGTGAVSAAPVWAVIADADVPASHSGSAHHAASHTHASHTGIGATDHHSNANDHANTAVAHSWHGSVATIDHHAETHTIVSHDTTATGANLNTLVGGGETTLHSHAGVGGHTHSGNSLGPLVQADFTTAAAPAAPGAAVGRFYVVTGDRPGFRSGAAGAAEVLATLETAQTWTALQSFGTNLGGTLQTAAQPNITSVGTLTSLTIGGALTTGTQKIGPNTANDYLQFTAGIVYLNAATDMYFVNDTDANSAFTRFYWYTDAADAGGRNVMQLVGNLTGEAVTLTIGSATNYGGRLALSGYTSGTVTLRTADAAGTWTMQLPAAVGGAGQQLTDAGGNGITSWAAASLGEWKNDLGILDPHEALKAVVSAPTHKFTYNKDVLPMGQSDGGGFQFTGIFAEEAPWAMYGKRDGYRSGIAFSNVNAFGYARAAIEALYSDLQDALAEIASLKVQVTALQGA